MPVWQSMKICPHNTRICSRYSSSLKKFAILILYFFHRNLGINPSRLIHQLYTTPGALTWSKYFTGSLSWSNGNPPKTCCTERLVPEQDRLEFLSTYVTRWMAFCLLLYILNYVIRVTIPSIDQGLKSDIPVNSFAAWFFVFVLL